ncbi:MAG: hypothetical protein HFH41_10295 [Lachnospiraceae bacterium]|nr:hypothetical protein [Lachnospiraceae bacterium]
MSSTEKSTWNGKQNSIIGAASTITSSNLTGNRVLISDSSGKVSASGVTSTELISAVPGYGGMYHTNSGFMTVSNANWTKVPIDAGAGNDCIRYNSSLKRLDILKAGHYAFLGSVTISSTGNAGYVKGVKILKDGIDVGYYATTKCVSTAPWTTISTPLFANSFSAGGYLELYFRDEGGSATIGHTYLTVIKVG